MNSIPDSQESTPRALKVGVSLAMPDGSSLTLTTDQAMGLMVELSEFFGYMLLDEDGREPR